MMSGSTDHHVDITETIELKLAAIKSHVSQTAHNEELDERIREWGLRNGEAAGLPEGRLAESFKIVKVG